MSPCRRLSSNAATRTCTVFTANGQLWQRYCNGICLGYIKRRYNNVDFVNISAIELGLIGSRDDTEHINIGLVNVSKALSTLQHDFIRTKINGVKQHNHAELGLQPFSTCHVVVLQSWLIAQLQEVINQSSCTSHALAEHLTSARNSVHLAKKPTNRLVVSICTFSVHFSHNGLLVCSFAPWVGSHAVV